MTTAVTLDLRYAGTPGLISVFLVPTNDGGFVLLDCGPASTLEVLESGVVAAGFQMNDLRAVLLTHIHLDHAAAAGTLACETACQIWAHPAGAMHLGNPEWKLLPSARRLYGDRLEPLFGSIQPVPEDLLREVDHGESVRIGNLSAVGWHTPGHAVHHVVWEVGSSVAAGDLAGIRLEGSTHVTPPMPPPDIDIGLWLQSIDLVLDLEPERLMLAHFGQIDDPSDHLQRLAGKIRRWAAVTREVISEGGEADDLERRLAAVDDDDAAEAKLPAELRAAYRRLCPAAENAAGLIRWATRGSGA